MKVYTRTGDAGTTSLVGGTRVSKSSPRLEAYGTADELNAHIGLLLALSGLPDPDRQLLGRVQNRLFNLGSQLATEPGSKYQPRGIAQPDVDMIEARIDAIEAQLPPHDRFILPGGTMAAAQAHVARTVCRRCERRMAEMSQQAMPVDPAAMKFVNRLSDYLFVLSRHLNNVAAVEEIFWEID